MEKNGGAFRLITADLVRPLLKAENTVNHQPGTGNPLICHGFPRLANQINQAVFRNTGSHFGGGAGKFTGSENSNRVNR